MLKEISNVVKDILLLFTDNDSDYESIIIPPDNDEDAMDKHSRFVVSTMVEGSHALMDGRILNTIETEKLKKEFYQYLSID